MQLWRVGVCALAFVVVAVLVCLGTGASIEKGLLIEAAVAGAVVGLLWHLVGAMVRWLRS